MVPPVDSYHYDLFRPHMLTSVPGPPPLPPREPGTAGPARQDQRWVYKLFRAGLFGPDDVPDIGPTAGLPEPRRTSRRGATTSSGSSRTSRSRSGRATTTSPTRTGRRRSTRTSTRSTCTSCRRRTPRDRLAQELVVDSTIEFAMQDVNTIEATHSALKTRAQNTFHLSDQELLIRQFHTVIGDTVAAHQSGEPRGVTMSNAHCRRASPTSNRTSPTGRWPRAPSGTPRGWTGPSTSWSRSTTRSPRAPRSAIAYLDGLDINALARRTRPGCCTCSTR